MKTYIKDILMNEGFVSQDFITVSVIICDDQESPHESATVSVYIDKTIKNVDEIKTTAIKEANAFLSRIIAEL